MAAAGSHRVSELVKGHPGEIGLADCLNTHTQVNERRRAQVNSHIGFYKIVLTKLSLWHISTALHPGMWYVPTLAYCMCITLLYIMIMHTCGKNKETVPGLSPQIGEKKRSPSLLSAPPVGVCFL